MTFITARIAELETLIAAHRNSFRNRVANWFANGKKGCILLACTLQNRRIGELRAMLQGAKKALVNTAQLLLPASAKKAIAKVAPKVSAMMQANKARKARIKAKRVNQAMQIATGNTTPAIPPVLAQLLQRANIQPAIALMAR